MSDFPTNDPAADKATADHDLLDANDEERVAADEAATAADEAKLSADKVAAGPAGPAAGGAGSPGVLATVGANEVPSEPVHVIAKAGAVVPTVAPPLAPLPAGQAAQGSLSDDEVVAVHAALDQITAAAPVIAGSVNAINIVRAALPPLPDSAKGVADAGTPVHDSTGDVPVDVKGQPIAQPGATPANETPADVGGPADVAVPAAAGPDSAPPAPPAA